MNNFNRLYFLAENNVTLPQETTFEALPALVETKNQERYKKMSLNRAISESNELLTKEENSKAVTKYIASHPSLMRWFFSVKEVEKKYRKDIEAMLGSELRELIVEVLSNNIEIDYLDHEEVYSLRETCNYCQGLEVEPGELLPCECHYMDLDDICNVWDIRNNYLYDNLEAYTNAMVCKSNSFNLYFQTTFEGYYNDTKLQTAWLYMSWWVIREHLA